ncbi:hypothetical protein [Streptomyces neyagawaensis]|uniref:hypothetical protein n=1 Tax=Streptomyces neyagawaensis TaxID=42238 RepID=UPI0006E26CCF|nr:hypothetical protein [Streptomyces neyagawaensis]MCL6734407.1 hypothetical protein [Streptomyces neyagawaensis]MDE1682036.1 hypothetical protein [Streptomyces neyagawaensis]
MSYPALFTTPGMRDFAEAVDAERQRQLAQFGDQHHPILRGLHSAALFEDMAQGLRAANDDPAQRCWMTILLEEAYEAGAEGDLTKFRAEVVQIAAVCQAIITDLDNVQRQGAHR